MCKAGRGTAQILKGFRTNFTTSINLMYLYEKVGLPSNSNFFQPLQDLLKSYMEYIKSETSSRYCTD